MKKLIFITDTLSSGGAERVISVLANRLANDYDVSIICLRSQQSFYEIDSKVTIIFLDNKYGNNWLKKFFALRSYVPSGGIVIAFMVSVYVYVLAALLLTKVPIIISERNDPSCHSWYIRLARRILVPRAQAIVVQTTKIAEYFLRFRHKVSVIYNPISEQYTWQSAMKANKERVIVNIARLSPQKNHFMLIDVFERVLLKYPEYKLYIYGEGEIHDKIQAYIDDKKLSDAIKLKGRRNNLEIELPKAKMFVLSSNYEGMSNALIEAMYVGVPVVTTNVSGSEELIENGRNGFVVPINNAELMYDAIISLLSNDELCDTIGIQGSFVKDMVNTDVIVCKWKNLINSI